MSEIEAKVEEHKISQKEANTKRLLGFISLLPYIFIGFIEMFRHYRADKDFKTNMLWLGTVGLAYFFNREIIIIFNFILKMRGAK